MEIDLYRDDGIPHVITTGASYVDRVLWVSTYFGVGRYDGRKWRAFYNMDSGIPNDFTNNLKARSGNEAYFCTDKGLGAIMDPNENIWVTYTRDAKKPTGKAVVYKDRQVLETIETELNVPHNYIIAADVDGDDIWIGTAKGLGWGIGEGYYPGLKERPVRVAANQGGGK